LRLPRGRSSLGLIIARNGAIYGFLPLSDIRTTLTRQKEKTRAVKYYSYILKCKDGTLYSGVAKDLAAREKTHNLGKGSRYVRAHGGGKIVFSMAHRSLSLALKREAAVKKMTRQEKLAILKSKRLIKVHGQPRNKHTIGRDPAESRS
jgi:putative endonuclease